MAHHGKQDDAALRAMLESLETTDISDRLGPTDRFPEGKLSESDEGELQFAVGVEKGKVVIHFGEPTMWIGLTPQQAADLAASIIQKARTISGSPFTVSL